MKPEAWKSGAFAFIELIEQVWIQPSANALCNILCVC